MENSLRKEFVHRVNIIGDKQNVFKAFCPIAEKEWVPNWDCTLLYSQTGIAEKNCIFTTKSDNMPEMVWVCSIYEPGNEVEYVRIITGYFVTVINIKTTQVNEYTECIVQYTHTALSAGGAHYILNNFSEEQFLRQIDQWKDEIPGYLKTSIRDI
ncbi:MAG TPA: hypothetical protein PKA10_14865 [Selenomonadales bacterium]|nr:hypothetical protein [Selenomonadales bacterium]